MRPALRRLVKRWGWKTPVMELINGSKENEFKKWFITEFITEPSVRALTTRLKDLHHTRRIFKIGFELYDLGKLPSWVLTGKPLGVRHPTVAPHPGGSKTIQKPSEKFPPTVISEPTEQPSLYLLPPATVKRQERRRGNAA